MNIEELTRQVRTLIEQSFQGQEIENPKIDFKAKWYNLSDNKSELNEFLKDTSSIANTFGLDGYIIIGFDEKNKTYINSKFSDCGLRDTSDVYPLIIKRVSESFDINIYDIEIEGKGMSVIHIPASINKPHVIKNYQKIKNNKTIGERQNVIFVRKSTGTYHASKYDLDLMYYDKKNNIPEYDIRVDVTKSNINNGKGDSRGSISLYPHFSIENLGRRPIAIRDIEIIVEKFELKFYLTRSMALVLELEKENNKSIIIRSNDINFYTLFYFKATGAMSTNKEMESLVKSDKVMRLTLTNGKIINVKINENSA